MSSVAIPVPKPQPANNGNNQKVQIRVDLENEIAEKFVALKRKFGLTSNAQLFRLLVTLAYNEISGEGPTMREVLNR